MAYRIKVENKYGEVLELTSNPNYKVKATGLSPMSANIVTAPVANYSGARYVSSKHQTRPIVLTIYVEQPVETNRINLYKYFKSKDWIRVYYSNGTREVYIDGYVESFDCDFFTKTQTAQVSILCPKPQFLAVTPSKQNIATTLGALSFPFYEAESEPVVLSHYGRDAVLVNNTSDDEVGFIYTIQCYGEVINPQIYIDETKEYFKLNRRFTRGSVITINTNDGNKSVTCELGGITTNIINSVDSGSKWLKLRAGYNHILQTAKVGLDSMVGELHYINEYEGV